MNSVLVLQVTLICLNCLLNVTWGDQCPKKGKVNVKKVPDILSLIEGQNGYYLTIEVVNKIKHSLVHEFYNMNRSIGYIDLESTEQDQINRRYYYHETNEKFVVSSTTSICTPHDLSDQNEKIESIQDWFQPADLVTDKSPIFSQSDHLGPSVLMIYASRASDIAQFVESKNIDGRFIDHWFTCLDGTSYYIDFYFDSKTGYPFRFEISKSTSEPKQTSDNIALYIYNFFIFKPLIINPTDPIPYPLGFGCRRKETKSWNVKLPDFTQIAKFTLDMEAVITNSNGSESIRSTARVMKYNDVYSIEITEGSDFVRSIENPPPFGRWNVDRYNGSCKYSSSDYNSFITLITRWPYHTDMGFNLLYYILMKPSPDHAPTYIGSIDLGSVHVEEYKAQSFFLNYVDAVVDYHFPVTNGKPDSLPNKIVFTPYYSNTDDVPKSIEVTIIDYRTSYYEIGDRFDVSGCFEEPGTYSWFQLVFSDPKLLNNLVDTITIRSDIEELLSKFIPITRISDIVINAIDANLYVNVKLNDRIPFLGAYKVTKGFSFTNPEKVLQVAKIEECEQICSANQECEEFSYCGDSSCYLDFSFSRAISVNQNCSHYSIDRYGGDTEWYKSNFLASKQQILHQIRSKIDQGQFKMSTLRLTPAEIFIVHDPDEIGDYVERLHDSNSEMNQFLRGDEYYVIQETRRLMKSDENVITDKVSIDYIECTRLCANDDNCATLSYCPNQNKECILSSAKVTDLNQSSSLDSFTAHADGCNIYAKSYLSIFKKYPGKSLVIDAISTQQNIDLTDCAKQCIKSQDFNCESFDYCSNEQGKETICFLHVNHISSDLSHEINSSNWKFSTKGCDHYSKKSNYDYKQIISHQLSPSVNVIETLDDVSLEHCADQCNSQSTDCFTFEYCETIKNTGQGNGLLIAEAAVGGIFDGDYSYHGDDVKPWDFLDNNKAENIKTTCKLSAARPERIPTSTKDDSFRSLFVKSSSEDDTICSVYVKTRQTKKKAATDRLIDHTNLAFGMGSFFFVLAFAVGFVGFKFYAKKQLN